MTPFIRDFEQRYSVMQGQDFTLTCEATGTPYPTVKWMMVR